MPTCFVIQPFDNGKYDKRYEDTFKPAIEAAELEQRSGSGNLDRGIGDGSAFCGDDNAADERSREHETTPP